MILRCSRLPLFFRCAGSHEDARPEDDEHDEPTVPQAMGLGSHAALAAYILFDMFESEFIEEIAEKYKIDSGELAYLFRNGTKGWGQLKEHFGGAWLDVENRRTLNITPEIVLTGKPDAAAYTKAVADWKSGYREYDSRWQLEGGGRLVFAKWGFTVWLREQAIDTYRLLTPKEFDAAIIRQCERFEAGERTAGPHCLKLYCPKIDRCDAYTEWECSSIGGFLPVPSLAQKFPILTPELLKMIWPMIAPVERRIAQIKSFVNDWIDRHGPLRLEGGTMLVRRESVTSKIDPSLALPIIEKYVPQEKVPQCFTVAKENLKGHIGLAAAKGKKAQRVRDCMKELEDEGALVYTRTLQRYEVKSESEGSNA